ncbi:hypothetical protein GJ496_003572 [Pomphorhynchus laevis]|nr:hypothetical protein GJ496_003572 [Pomphorhynchus laevis]
MINEPSMYNSQLKKLKNLDFIENGLVSTVDLGTILPSFKGYLGHNDQKVVKEDCQPMRDLVKPHIDSFNDMIDMRLSKAVQRIQPIEFEYKGGNRLKFEICDAEIYKPSIALQNSRSSGNKLYPAECRIARTTYKAPLMVKIKVFSNGSNILTFKKRLAEVPIMVMSKGCNLYGLDNSQLVKHKEENNEGGGYFIINGSEKLIRLLSAQRRNYPAAVKRTSWKSRGPGYSDLGLVIRCVRDDGAALNNMIHYLTNGTCTICFAMNGQLFYIPFIVIIRALTNECDFTVYGDLMNYNKRLSDNYGRCLKAMLRQLLEVKITSQTSALMYIGLRFRDKLQDIPHCYSDEEIGRRVIEESIFTHLDEFRQKYQFAVFCVRKLFALAENRCKPDPIDTTMMHELVLPGQVYLSVLVEKMQMWLRMQRGSFLKTIESKNATVNSLQSLLQTMFSQPATVITRGMEHFLATGNVSARCSVASLQTSGWVIMAERINILRYLAHFRSVHRGSALMSMRSSSVRRLCPESFGFICPVNTPDGGLCGILTHLSAHCYVSTDNDNTIDLIDMLISHGMTPDEDFKFERNNNDTYEIQLDGLVIGKINKSDANNLFQFLREQKAIGNASVPKFLEICLIESCYEGENSLYPGVYLFSSANRMMRPVFNIATRTVEYVGTMEQVYMGIASEEKSFITGHTTHYELIPYSFMSFVAALTPFSEFNQSPRNMYQCQMGKQAVGTACHYMLGRSDNKLYQLVNAQSPLVKTRSYEFYDMDQYPSGINAVVAVLSYTGYDMEDAMIINKASSDRGFGKTLIYTTEVFDISDRGKKGKQSNYFYRSPENKSIINYVDVDGLPIVGVMYSQSDPLYSYISQETGEVTVVKYKKDEAAIVVQIALIGSDTIGSSSTRACVLFQKCRDPIIGDKFSSRHGQKGVCSKLYPVTDLPFNEHGITPDIIFNPHGFPSRMTLGMMLEFLTAKSGAILGKPIDASPFQFDDDRDDEVSSFDFFGEILRRCGFSHHGTEIMYSGITGETLEVSVFTGMVFYQRLRHMVSDKFQVRRTGCYDVVTRQPLKGRKRGGGIRVGEMERDAILAHGCAFTLVDRLLNCSDRAIVNQCDDKFRKDDGLQNVERGCSANTSLREARRCEIVVFEFHLRTKFGVSELFHLLSFGTVHICRKCGIIGTLVRAEDGRICKLCSQSKDICKIALPYVLTYLIAELSSVNIATVLTLNNVKSIK